VKFSKVLINFILLLIFYYIFYFKTQKPKNLYNIYVMTKILKFKEHQNWYNIAENLIDGIINPPLLESTENQEEIISILKNLQRDLNFNTKLIFTFGTGIASMYPIVLSLIENQNLKVDLTTENIVLLTLTSVVILALETEKDMDLSKEDAKTLLTELKLRGIGNGIVKKMVNCLKSLGNVMGLLFKNTPKVVRNLVDMFGYTSLLIPTMNALSSIINDYGWTMDTIIGNLSSLGVGILTFLAKNGFDYLVNKLKKKVKLNPELDKMSKTGNAEVGDVEDYDAGNAKLIREQ